MAITAADVKKLRDATGAGMMDAKKALTEADGDFEKAIEALRVSGAAKAAKRSDREAVNGLVASCGNALIQLGSETDFVAKNAEFTGLAEKIVAKVNEAKVGDKAAVLALDLDGKTIEQSITDLSGTIGEKIELGNVAYFEGDVEVYLHRRSQDLPPQVGVMVEYTGGNAELMHQIALQIASMMPQYVSRDDVDAAVLETESRIAEERAREEGKPEKIIPKIVEGRLNSFYKEACLVEQAAVSDEKKTVGQLLEAVGAKVTRFVRFSTGA